MQEQNHFFESEDHTMEFDTQDAQDAKVWSILAYFGILFFLPLVGVPNSAYGKFHANQGLILLIFDIALSVASWLVQAVLGIIPIIGGILSGLVQLAVSVCVWCGAGCTGQGKDVASDWKVSSDWITGNRVCGSVAS